MSAANKAIEKIYLVGSLRNPEVPVVAQALRRCGYYVYDEWFACGPEADDWWKSYCQGRGLDYIQGLDTWAATHPFRNDKQHLDECDAAVLVLPCGKSGHLELGYMIGRGGKGFILMDKSDVRWDMMYNFADGVYYTLETLVRGMGGNPDGI